MATGYYHKHNVLKLRILEAMMIGYYRKQFSMTAMEIAEAGEIEYKKVCGALYHWKRKNNYDYVTRLRKKAANGAYRYKITKNGIAAYLDYRNRMKKGFDLNRCRRVPKRVAGVGIGDYYGINQAGRVMGLTLEDLVSEEKEVGEN